MQHHITLHHITLHYLTLYNITLPWYIATCTVYTYDELYILSPLLQLTLGDKHILCVARYGEGIYDIVVSICVKECYFVRSPVTFTMPVNSEEPIVEGVDDFEVIAMSLIVPYCLQICSAAVKHMDQR